MPLVQEVTLTSLAVSSIANKTIWVQTSLELGIEIASMLLTLYFVNPACDLFGIWPTNGSGKIARTQTRTLGILLVEAGDRAAYDGVWSRHGDRGHERLRQEIRG